VNLTGFSAIHTAVLTGRGPQFLAAGLFSHVLLQSVGPNVLSRLSSAFNKQNTATAVGIRVSYDTQLDRDIAQGLFLWRQDIRLRRSHAAPTAAALYLLF
jgi:hypothetical protein